MIDIDKLIADIDPTGDMPTIYMSGNDERTLSVSSALRSHGYTVINKPIDELNAAGRKSVLTARKVRRLAEQGLARDEIDNILMNDEGAE
jgi:hypothetical protein